MNISKREHIFIESTKRVWSLPGAPNRANLTYAQFVSDRGRVIGGTQLEQSKTDFATRLCSAARLPLCTQTA